MGQVRRPFVVCRHRSQQRLGSGGWSIHLVEVPSHRRTSAPSLCLVDDWPCRTRNRRAWRSFPYSSGEAPIWLGLRRLLTWAHCIAVIRHEGLLRWWPLSTRSVSVHRGGCGTSCSTPQIAIGDSAAFALDNVGIRSRIWSRFVHLLTIVRADSSTFGSTEGSGAGAGNVCFRCWDHPAVLPQRF